MDLRTAASFLLACLFGFMLFQSRRFIEYFPAFSLVFAAFAWTAVFQKGLTSRQGQDPHQDSARDRAGTRPWMGPSWMGVTSPRRLSGGLRNGLPAIALLLALVPGAWMTFHGAKASLQSSKPHDTYARASAWLAANTPAGERVFQTDWDDFPRLFYYNTHNTYLIGLDPTYMLIYDPDLYRLWVDLTQGEIERPSEAIERDFGAHYVLTDLRHGDFLGRAAADPGLVEVYRDEEAVVFQISD
jgi:hypothetical protein